MSFLFQQVTQECLLALGVFLRENPPRLTSTSFFVATGSADCFEDDFRLVDRLDMWLDFLE